MDSITASLDHLERLRRRRDYLRDLIAAAEEQLGHRVGVELAEGIITETQAHDVWERFRTRAEPGFSHRWPMPRMSADRIHLPNNGEGWYGTNPLGTREPRPRNGQAVVYVLFDHEGQPCYVGSTAHLANRLRGHRRDGKHFAQWSAYPFPTREAAYQAEDSALKDITPYLNVRAGR